MVLKNKVENKNLYLMEYWRNDGEWHNSGTYDCSPILTFYAKDDKEAKEIALDYIFFKKRKWEETNLLRIVELKIEARELKLNESETATLGKDCIEKKPIPKEIEKKITSIEFLSLEERILIK